MPWLNPSCRHERVDLALEPYVVPQEPSTNFSGAKRAVFFDGEVMLWRGWQLFGFEVLLHFNLLEHGRPRPLQPHLENQMRAKFRTRRSPQLHLDSKPQKILV
jgi:hypothetical protein